jgi:hypothetical protein
MTSTDPLRGRVLVCALAAGMLLASAAHAEGTFFKNRRGAATTTTGSGTPVPPIPATPGPAANSSPTPPPPSPQQHDAGAAGRADPAPAPPPAAPAPAAAARSGSVDRVLTTDTLSVGGQQVQLAGVEGVGGPVTQGLSHYLQSQGNHLSCTPVGGRFRCVTDAGKDLGLLVLLNGAGRATADAPREYHAAENQARANNQGIWHR